MTQTKPLLINNYESINTYIPNNNKIYGIYIFLLFILSLCIVNTIFFIRINSIINDIQPYISQLKTLINLACKNLQC
jgi:hypothetical protein